MTKNADGESICSRMERLVVEFEQSKDPDSTEIGRQFAQLQRTLIENQDILSCSEGAKPSNRLKNRYKDILPYDKYRVILQTNNDSDYINASYIEDLYGHCRYIAAQGPIDDSLVDFIHMVWQFRIISIICTANDVEAGRFKFRRYWPDDDEESLQIGPYQITKDSSNDKNYHCNDYEVRSLIITHEDTQRHVLLYHVLHWPDHDIPNDEIPIHDLLLRLYKDRDFSTESPILVHCSAGCGRTGSLIAIDLCRLLLNDEHLFLSKDYQPNPILKVALHIRRFRIALIQTLKQYLFVYKLFLFIMKTNGNDSLYSITNNDENQTLLPPSTQLSSSRRPSVPLQITLRNPPIGRRLLNGSNSSNTPSPTVSPSEFFSSTSKSSSLLNDTPTTPEPPPIPPRCSLKNTTNKQHTNESEGNTNRSRNARRKDSQNSRSDSADALSLSSSRHYHRQLSSEQDANSD